MTTALILTMVSGVYTMGVMVTARVLHIKAYTAWMRWKNAEPDHSTKLYHDGSYGSGGYYTVERSKVSLYAFMKASGNLLGKELLPRGTAFFWPFFAPVWLVKKFCFPEVKIPDAAKIHDLEYKELKDL